MRRTQLKRRLSLERLQRQHVESFANQTANSTSHPSCASDDAGRVICAMLNTASAIIVNRYNGTAWEGFLNIGGHNTGSPVCTDIGVSGQVSCFGRGEDTALLYRQTALRGALMSSIDAALAAEQYASARGLSVRFGSEDLRAMALSRSFNMPGMEV